MNPTEIEIPAHYAGMRLDQVLAQLLPDYSRSRLQAWIRGAHVLLDGVAANAKQKVKGCERISVIPPPAEAELASAPEAIVLAIRYEDDSLMVIDKPAGLVVHPGSGNWSGTLLNALLHHTPALSGIPRAGIVHRLDKDTSGLMVVAKTLTAQTALVRQMQARSITREYLAVVHGQVARDGTVDAPIGRHAVQRTKMAVVHGGREAVTHYQVLERFAQHTLVRCRLETGRTHQIRVHMQSIGHPLVGDPTYGGRARAAPPALAAAIARLGRQALHAARLELTHPVSGQRLSWEAPLPDDLRALLDALRTTA